MSLTAAVFSFDAVSQSGGDDVLVCNCTVTADMPFFKGHFPGLPLMPAVAQLEMIRALLEKHSGWNVTIAGGSGLKFSGRIQPDDKLTIRLQRRPSGDISFNIESSDTLISKGILQLAGDTHG